MKTYISHINGKDYLYATDSIYVAKGKTIQKNKSLGPAENVKDIARKKKDFFEYVLKEEARLRFAHWGRHIHDPKFVKYVRIEKIEELRARLYRSKQGMGDIATGAMETAFQVDFIYNSNRIEGSKIPRESVEEIVRQGAKNKNNEVTNTIRAINFIDSSFRFNLKQIDKLHDILLAHQPSQLGLRKEKVVVGNADVSEWQHIKKDMKSLLDWYKKSEKNMYPPELAFTFYYRFERIHPFVDGNGRVGRLLMNAILRKHRYHPMIIWNKRRQTHMSAFKKYMDGRAEYYFKFMAEQFIKTHEIYTEKIDKAFNLEEQIQYFLQPSSYNLD